MKKPEITKGKWEVFIGARMDMGQVCGLANNTSVGVKHTATKDDTRANAQAISAVPNMLKALIAMYHLWWNEVYEFGYGKYEGNEEKATALANNDKHIQLMREALKKAGCTDETIS